MNEDGSLSADDARQALQHFVGTRNLSDSQRGLADINQDSNVTPVDALCIFQEFMNVSSCLD